MQRPIIQNNRSKFIVGTKTASHTYEATWKRIEEDLEELVTDYIDIFYLRTYNHEMLDAHLSPDGSMKACLEARKQGKIHAIGLAGHSDLTALSRGVETGLVDVVQFPLNVVRREASETVIPACLKHDSGMVIMKPVNVGLVPAEICLPWLANQPVHVMAPGISTLEQLELDVKVLDRQPMTLTPLEEVIVESWREEKNLETCRICDKVCQVVCEPGLKIDWLLYHNVFQNELRRLGVHGFLEYPFAPWVKEQAENIFTNTLTELQSCTNCGKCLEVCPYHLPTTDLIARMKIQQAELVEELRSMSWDEEYQNSATPLPKNILSSWISGGKKKS